MKNEFSVSIIVPVYNAEEYISDCLDSLVGQTVKPLEIIVVDNGSTDNTCSIIREYDQIHLIIETRSGVSWARNRGAKSAKGKILAFLDSDCIANNDWLEKAFNIFNENKKIDGVQGTSVGINRNIWATFFQKSYDDFLKEIVLPNGKIIKIDTKNFFIKQQAFEEIGGFDVSLGNSEDVDLGIRLHMHSFHMILSSFVIVSHLNPSSLEKRICVRKEQGFFDFRIYKNIPSEKRNFYFPTFQRKYSNLIFNSKNPSRVILQCLSFIAKLGVIICTSVLRIMNSLRLAGNLYVLYHLLMAFAIFRGKLLSKRVDLNYLDIESIAESGEFSRRIING